MIKNHESKLYDKLASENLHYLPKSYHDKNFKEQIRYVKSIQDKTEKMSFLASELLMKAKTTEDFLAILEIQKVALTPTVSNLFLKQWEQFEGYSTTENSSKFKKIIQSSIQPSKWGNPFNTSDYLKSLNCTLNFLTGK